MTPAAPPGAVPLRRLANLLSHHAPKDGPFELRMPGVWAIRKSSTTTEPIHATIGPALCIIAQGAKVVMLGADVVEYNPARLLMLSADLPLASHVTRASVSNPFLGFVLQLDPPRVAKLAARVYPRGIPKQPADRAMYAGATNDGIIEAIIRLLELMSEPKDAELLAPLVIDEILIRLLRMPIGGRVAQMGHAQSGLHRVARSVEWIREHFAQPVTVQEMAASIGMRPSSFHQQFKAVMAMSPLQYQKVLRLHEARRLMLFQKLDTVEASRRVGYLSPSQFSREYSRFFGAPPTKDVAQLRGEAFAPRA
jgi:AraC-like DNA-binding protein